MIKELQVRVEPRVAASQEALARYVAESEGLDTAAITHVRILRRSIDARQRRIFVNLSLRVYVGEPPQDDEYVKTKYGDVGEAPQVVVVGEGPGGLFASLRLIELGLRPVVLERGKDVTERRRDLAAIARTQQVDANSNYCFGEGGAGAYSDGKLYTRSKKRGNVEKILNVFCQHGASTAILADAHPHIGTDKLPRVIANMRDTILRCGGEVHHQTCMTRLLVKDDAVVGVEAIDLRSGDEKTFMGPVILATGHSARDVYRYLYDAGIEIEAKGLAVGVCLEHPSHLIDQIQYHNKEGRGKYLPAAEYSMVTQVDGRGVYSFCMCPGGFVIPAATGPEQLVVNGMSPSNRNKKQAYKKEKTNKKKLIQKNNNNSNKSEKKKFSQKHPKIVLFIKICLLLFVALIVTIAGIICGMIYGGWGDDFAITKEELVIGSSNSLHKTNFSSIPKL